MGQKFVVKTYQRSLKYLLGQRLITEEHQKWLAKLLGYNFEIHYKPGQDNKAADALSCRVETASCLAILIPHFQNWEALIKELKHDLELEMIKQKVMYGVEGFEEYRVEDDCLLYKGRLVLPRTSRWIPQLFQEFHSSVIGGHAGILKTYQLMQQNCSGLG